MLFKAAVFDLDGTLINSVADLGSAVNRVLESNGFPVHELVEYNQFIGDGARVMVKKALPADSKNEEVLNRCYNQFMDDYRVNFSVKTALYDGISELLDYLAENKIILSILTNKPHEITINIVDALLSKWDFKMVIGHKEGLPRKPDITGAKMIIESMNVAPEQIVYFGDSGIDMKTASSSGMLPVGVLWGFRGKEELIRDGAKHLISNPLDIIDIADFKV